MFNRYLTHFGSIFLGHILLLFGSWQIVQNQYVQKSMNLGSTVLKLQMAREAIRPLSLPEQVMTPRPAKKKLAPAPLKETLSQPTASSPTLSEEVKADLLSQYKSELRAKIEENKFYPPASRRLGQTGTVIVAFTLLKDGHIINVRIDSPSSYERLNESALEAVKRVHGFKPIPVELELSQMDIKVPVKFFTI